MGDDLRNRDGRGVPRTGPCVLHVVGARPNFVKMAPVIEAVGRAMPDTRQEVVHTEQHYDTEMSRVFFDELGLARPTHSLDVGSGSHGAQTARALERIERVLQDERPAALVVAGDVNSTLAAALAAAKLDVPVAHVESGLRSFDRTMPEEVNRVLTDQLARWCFTHSPEAEENLLREGVAPSRIHFVGNTMIDTLVRLRDRFAASDVHAQLGLERGNYLLVTLHRPSLVDGPLLDATMSALAGVAQRLTVVFPVHPRTRAQLRGYRAEPQLRLIDPQPYVDFMALMSDARAVLTDSGGVQEETTFLGIPCFTLRTTTERPVTVSAGTNRLLGLDPSAIAQIPDDLAGFRTPVRPPEGWDGHAAERLARVLAGDVAAHADVGVPVSAAG